MALNYISAAEAASLIKHGYNIGLSGFTPAGTAKAVTAELAKIAEAEHAKGNPFQIGIFTGASTGDSCDGVLSRVKNPQVDKRACQLQAGNQQVG